ncbi:MAG: hypothetical protein ABSB35_00735 [Bryobacteraceae bacterium]
MKATRSCGFASVLFAALLPGQVVQQYTISTIVGTQGTPGSPGGTVGDGGPANMANLDLPFAVVSAGGNLYIADEADNLIRLVSKGNISSIAGVGTTGYTGDNGPATQAQLDSPSGIAVDGSGNVYVADTANNVIRFVTQATGKISTMVYPGNTLFPGSFTLPSGLAMDSSGNLYISNTGTNQVYKVTNPLPLTPQQGMTCLATPTATGCPVVTLIAGDGQEPGDYLGDGVKATATELNNPEGIAVDKAGNVYIADSQNNRIRMVSAVTGIITTVAGSGFNAGFGGDGGPATSALLNHPEGVAVDAAGNIYIADEFNYRIRKVSNGIITTIAGNGRSGYTGDGGVATSAQLFLPGCVATDSTGNVYVCDTQNDVIRQLTPIALPVPALSAVENSATGGVRDTTHAVAPNSFISIYASNIGTSSSPAAGLPFPSYSFPSSQGVQVLVNGTPVPIYDVTVTSSFSLINTVMPSNLPTTGTATITVQTPGGSSQTTVALAPEDVGIFRLSADPAHPSNGAVLEAGKSWLVMPASTAAAYGLPACTGLANNASCGQPANPGDNISIYFSGGGLATPNANPGGSPVPTGQVAPASGTPLYELVQMPTVTIGGLSAPVAAAIAPGTGSEYQINTTIPAGVQAGDKVPVVVTIGNSSDTVTIAVN